MLTEALAALAAAAGTGLVSAMTTTAWEEVRVRFSEFLGRNETGQVARQEGRLERSRQELASAGEEEKERVHIGQEAVWRARFEDLLESEPAREAELRALVSFLSQRLPATASGAVQVNAQAYDHAQQAVQGQGVQSNTFGASQ